MHCSPEDSLGTGEQWTGERKQLTTALPSQANLGELFFTHLTCFPFKHCLVITKLLEV
jgi:hypothetical protein